MTVAREIAPGRVHELASVKTRARRLIAELPGQRYEF